MKAWYALALLLGVDALILCLQTSHISISFDEASLLYGSFSFLQLFVKSSLELFGENDFGLRFVMIFFHLASALLIYLISLKYIDSQRNRLWLVFVFILLPGVVSAAVVVNSAGMVIFGLLLFVYLSERVRKIFSYSLLLVFALIDGGFSYLFLGLLLYFLSEKEYKSALYVFSLYIVTSSLYGFNIFGYPKGHLLDTIGVYSAVFTPIIFVYLFYALYRRYITKQTDMLWYIAATTLTLSLFLSFRQRIAIEYFAPYLIVALPLAAQSFISSYRVRLKMFRTRYRLAFVISLIFLVSNTLLVFFNKSLYYFMDNPKHHFAYEMHIAKELATELKQMGIDCIKTDEKMQKRLVFYKINKCDQNILTEIKIESPQAKDVTISYTGKELYSASVTKINNL